MRALAAVVVALAVVLVLQAVLDHEALGVAVLLTLVAFGVAHWRVFS